MISTASPIRRPAPEALPRPAPQRPVGSQLAEDVMMLLGEPLEVGSTILYRPAGSERAMLYRVEELKGEWIHLVPAERQEPQWVKLAPGRSRVLVVEDDPILRFLVGDSLDFDGFEVRTAGSGDEALALLEGGQAFDAVVSDIDMPGSTNGVALARWILRERPHSPVILTSGHRPRAEELPAGVTFLPKPACLTELARTVWRVIDKATSSPRSVTPGASA
jgi:CheY-like chemotaxis protein